MRRFFIFKDTEIIEELTDTQIFFAGHPGGRMTKRLNILLAVLIVISGLFPFFITTKLDNAKMHEIKASAAQVSQYFPCSNKFSEINPAPKNHFHEEEGLASIDETKKQIKKLFR